MLECFKRRKKIPIMSTDKNINIVDTGAENSSEQDWDFLKCVHQLLVDGNVLQTTQDHAVIDFKFPDELKQLIDFEITDDGNNDPNEMRKICEQVIQLSLKTNHPHFHNQLFGGVDPYGLAGSWITDALNTSQYTFEVGPVFTMMENEMIQTFCKLFGFDNGDGIFSPGGSLSNMYGMVLARYRAIPNVKATGCFGIKPLVVFTSDQSHYSIKKAIHWLGIGTDNLIIVKTDENGCMLIDDLVRNIENVLKENRQPFFVNATAGTTVLGAFDNLEGIADVCEMYNLWMHVDACLGGSIILSLKHKHRLYGVHRADSIAWNPHKSLGVPLQCSMFLIKENGLMHKCNSSAATYLFQQDKFYDVSYDTGDKSVQCGRKVDVFKFWLMLKARGLHGFERLINSALDKAAYLTDALASRIGFRLVQQNRFQYTNVSFWYIPTNMRNQTETDIWWNRLYAVAPAIKELMVKRGTIMIGYQPLPCKNLGNFFRMTLACFPPITEEAIDFLLDEIERIGEQIQ